MVECKEYWPGVSLYVYLTYPKLFVFYGIKMNSKMYGVTSILGVKLIGALFEIYNDK